MQSSVQSIVPIGLHWPTLDPFLFCAHHCDRYPAGTASLGVEKEALEDRSLGQDFTLKEGWRMYHGEEVPGFPRHPHRGFETITLAKQGFVDHCDSLGASARFGEGDIQWMTAGDGVVHSEMFPLVRQDAENPSELFQIWLNLPAQSKRCAPYFTMIWAEGVPVVQVTDARGLSTSITVLVGVFQGKEGAAPPPDSWASLPEHNVQIWQVDIPENGEWTLPRTVSSSQRVLYFYEGERCSVDGQQVEVNHAIHLRSDVDVRVQSTGRTASFMLLQGEPIGEPVAQHGPFVMNSRVEIEEAFSDYRRTGFGGWPWPKDDPVHGPATPRFARHADGRMENPEDK